MGGKEATKRWTQAGTDTGVLFYYCFINKFKNSSNFSLPPEQLKPTKRGWGLGGRGR